MKRKLDHKCYSDWWKFQEENFETDTVFCEDCGADFASAEATYLYDINYFNMELNYVNPLLRCFSCNWLATTHNANIIQIRNDYISSKIWSDAGIYCLDLIK